MDWGSTFKPKGEEELCVVFTDRWTGERSEGATRKGEQTRTLCGHLRGRWGGREKGVQK